MTVIENSPNLLSLSSYDFELPRERIASFPLEQRDHSKMLVVNRQTRLLSHHNFYDLPQFLAPNDVMVLNNTKVLPCRVFGNRIGLDGQPCEGVTEIFFLNQVSDDGLTWLALCRPAKKLLPGTNVVFPNLNTTADIVSPIQQGKMQVRVNLADGFDSVEDFIQAAGTMPIPPYVGRKATKADIETYQTVFAKTPGSHAAPTAGLHMTPAVMDAITANGTAITELTLNVSTGTFREVLTDDITDHVMDAETYTMPASAVSAINAAKAKGGSVLAVGTTACKTMETVATNNSGQLTEETGASQLFIYPGYPFKVVDKLLTNFHLPKSTLMMLVSAFADRDFILEAYNEAINTNYRFYSYGDCMLII